MNDVVKGLSYFGGLVRGHPPVLSPTLDDFELMQLVQQPLKPAPDDFRILFNVCMFQPHEIDIRILNGKVVKICASHSKKQCFDGVWMTRDCTYTFDIPPDLCNKQLQAQWSEDDYLLIQATSAVLNTDDSVDECKLVIQRVGSFLKPTVEVKIVKEMMEDIRDKAQYALRYIRFYSCDHTSMKAEMEKLPLFEEPTKAGSVS